MRINTIEKGTNKRKTGNGKQKKLKGKNIFTTLFFLGTLGTITGMTLLYGPWSFFREWLVTTAMTTMTHQYYATIFYDENTIDYILDKNKVVETDDDTNPDLITTGDTYKTVFENEYERQILERDSKNNDYKVIPIDGKGYDGYMVAIYEPSRIRAVVTKNLGASGQYVTKMASDHDALVAINGGGFDDPNYVGTGGSPLGVTITSGKVVSGGWYGGNGGVIGFDKQDKLILGKMTLEEAQKKGIRDAVTFGPFLIVNGKKSEVLGNGGWGTAPRTAIGQRKDGIVLFLVLDGRKATKPGATMNDIIKIMEQYGAYNAANLDGGTSTVLVIDSIIVNDPIDLAGSHRTRPVASAFILDKDGKDNSDHSIIQDKLDKYGK